MFRVLLIVLSGAFVQQTWARPEHCLSPAQEQPFCFYLVDLWTWDEGAGRCVSYRDCPGDYGTLEKNAYYSLAECRVTCEFA